MGRFPRKQLSLVNDEEVISLSHAKVSDSVLCLEKMNQNPTFFFERDEMKVQGKSSPQSKLAVASQSTYGSRPTCLKSRSTSWNGGHWPSAPLTPGSPSRDIATARATVQEIKDPHRSRHACSARFRSKGLNERTFARANELKNDWVSTDQRPQTSTPSTTKRARPVTTNEFWVGPFLASSSCGQGCPIHMGTSRFAVSMECAHNRGVDGQLGPPEQRQAISDNLQPPSVGNVGLGEVEVTDHDVRRDSAACLPTDPSGHGLQRVPPPSQDPSPCASCTVVATKIEWKATPAEARGQGKREIEAAKEDNAKELWFDPRDATGWAGGQGETSSRATLRPDKRLTGIRQPDKQVLVSESSVHT